MANIISIPEYIKKYTDSEYEFKYHQSTIPCPIHKGTSYNFSYSAEKEICTCFSRGCVRGADVYQLHQKLYKFKDLEDAKADLYHREGLDYKSSKIQAIRDVNMERTLREREYYNDAFKAKIKVVKYTSGNKLLRLFNALTDETLTADKVLKLRKEV